MQAGVFCFFTGGSSTFDSFSIFLLSLKQQQNLMKIMFSCIHFPIWPYPPQIMIKKIIIVLVNCMGWQVCNMVVVIISFLLFLLLLFSSSITVVFCQSGIPSEWTFTWVVLQQWSLSSSIEQFLVVFFSLSSSSSSICLLLSFMLFWISRTRWRKDGWICWLWRWWASQPR